MLKVGENSPKQWFSWDLCCIETVIDHTWQPDDLLKLDCGAFWYVSEYNFRVGSVDTISFFDECS